MEVEIAALPDSEFLRVAAEMDDRGGLQPLQQPIEVFTK
jgi:hypothetical protein